MISRISSSLLRKCFSTTTQAATTDTTNKITIRESINRALEQEMRRDKNIFIIG